MMPLAESQVLEINTDDHAFDYPWQAGMFSLTVNLYKTGLFPWSQWVEFFSNEIKRSPRRPDESVNDAYYRQWAVAFEAMLETLGLVTGESVEETAQAWRLAYLNTPHGLPVLLENANCSPAKAHHHHHSAPGTPIAVSPTTGHH
ncbi:nitrile hydratase accessory protein [Pseudomonas asturiensis]|uniref:Nitrile hydratase accessory protein n=1 Tax=Pseudomonas asturiensis TaxID=1190415 RepID=A0A1M7PUD4_9PSED|nr:nitrile hydratase accessory protein [Pseudomonas asturiensis]SHN21127.1 nitrile hydratase accessory protein [Pseudomonas asturiensis]